MFGSDQRRERFYSGDNLSTVRDLDSRRILADISNINATTDVTYENISISTRNTMKSHNVHNTYRRRSTNLRRISVAKAVASPVFVPVRIRTLLSSASGLSRSAYLDALN